MIKYLSKQYTKLWIQMQIEPHYILFPDLLNWIIIGMRNEIEQEKEKQWNGDASLLVFKL